MNVHEQLIEEFYAAFAAHEPETMLSCYHKDIVFTDPVFGTLHNNDVADMWRMLVDRSKGSLQIEFSDIHAANNDGRAKWIATYTYTKTNRKIVNEIDARFEFKDDLIIRHVDTFDLYKWCKQAMGLRGTLLGWMPFVKNRIQRQAISMLRKYQSTAKNPNR